MPKVELKTRMRTTGHNAPELILDLLLVPRGSGNRAFASALARTIRSHPTLGKHVRRVVAGSSRVMVSLTPSVALGRVIFTWNAERLARESQDVEGQLGLFEPVT